MTVKRNPMAFTGEEGASLANQVGFFLVFLPAGVMVRIVGDPGEHWLLAGVLVALSGLLGGWLFGLGRAPVRAGLMGGPIASVGGALLAYFWLARREQYFIGEFVLMWAFGSAPGVLVYKEACEVDSQFEPPQD
ncbi:hypothetical protein [Vitiosangium sp. GDMCC 1.1324]|uniref:hypothetical protein n=1 Tax=Vitiosangium sp. (strain GDMCC 1.1324) TaxID=2138576 RepID=UPI000D3BFB20|nr:hypothetical protein [Vitiosangium sp. GDMCC 1.1324]PTL75425.1 hypothetical protein DAT35_54910 [Vitiosangium sp. GDMCC 1.1324]